eukprot:2421127-Rhodomonas_salina.1
MMVTVTVWGTAGERLGSAQGTVVFPPPGTVAIVGRWKHCSHHDHHHHRSSSRTSEPALKSRERERCFPADHPHSSQALSSS